MQRYELVETGVGYALAVGYCWNGDEHLASLATRNVLRKNYNKDIRKILQTVSKIEHEVGWCMFSRCRCCECPSFLLVFHLPRLKLRLIPICCYVMCMDAHVSGCVHDRGLVPSQHILPVSLTSLQCSESRLKTDVSVSQSQCLRIKTLYLHCRH